MSAPAITTGGICCAMCGVFIPSGHVHSCATGPTLTGTGYPLYTPAPALSFPAIAPVGWTCPSCGRGLAPWVSVCPHPLPALSASGAPSGSNGSER